MKSTYSFKSFAGVKSVILEEGKLETIIGLPLDGSLGWYEPSVSTEYRCWWVHNDYLELGQLFTKSKFK